MTEARRDHAGPLRTSLIGIWTTSEFTSSSTCPAHHDVTGGTSNRLPESQLNSDLFLIPTFFAHTAPLDASPTIEARTAPVSVNTRQERRNGRVVRSRYDPNQFTDLKAVAQYNCIKVA